MRHITLTLLLTFFIAAAFAQDKIKNYDEAFTLIEVWLEAQKDFDQLPGLSAIVIEDQKVLWSGAVGLSNAEGKVKATDATLGSICSISKLFTSVAIMKLYDEGKLRLDDRIEDLLPAYNLKQQFPESGPITIRSLMTHSSGLPRESAHPYWTGPDFPFPTKENVDASLKDQETLYPASTYYQYSNLGLTLLGEVVEELSGVSFEEYVEENILIPLGLSNTRPYMPEELYGKELAIGYTAMTRAGSREKVNFFQANGITPAAGFSSNVVDLGKFASWQFRLRDTTITEILKPSTLKDMHRVHWTNPDWDGTWGLGFAVYKDAKGNTRVGHGGSCPGYRSTLQLDLKNKRAYSVIINASGTNPGSYANGIESILSKAEEIKKNSTEEAKDLTAYIGFYNASPWWGELYVGSWNGQLVTLSLPSEDPGERMTLYKHVEKDTFRRIRDDGELGEAMTFERNANGEIKHFKRNDNYSKKIK